MDRLPADADATTEAIPANRMESVHREGIDVGLALASDIQRVSANRSGGVRSVVAGSGARALERSGNIASSVLWSLARGIYRLASPVRPIGRRARTVMLGSLEEEVRQSRRRIDDVWRFAQASQRRVAVAAGPDKVLVRTEAGYVVCSTDDLGTLAVLIEAGDLERGTRLLIERIVEPGDVVIDVGANLGLHTLAAARALRGKGRVHALEPFESTAKLLRENIAINGFSHIVRIHEVAASDHEGQEKLFLGTVSGHHSLFPLETPRDATNPSIDVQLRRLDDLIDGDERATLIKIDAEGAELEVLAGARSIIQRSPELALIVEFGPVHLSRRGHSAKDWFAAFEALGLTFKEIDPENGRLSDRSIEALAGVESANLLFAVPSASVWYMAGR